MTSPPRKYDYTRYNQYDVLRLNWAYWLITLFQARHLTLLMLIGVSAGRTGSGPHNPALAALLDPVFFVSDLPAVLLLFVAGARLPKTGRLARILWGWGRYLMLAASGIYLALLVWQQGAGLARFQPVTWGLVALNVIVMVYVMRSAYLRDMFAQFPDPDCDPDR